MTEKIKASVNPNVEYIKPAFLFAIDESSQEIEITIRDVFPMHESEDGFRYCAPNRILFSTKIPIPKNNIKMFALSVR